MYRGRFARTVSRTKPNFYPVILAGGRGTRFWPLSRKRRAKQLLALDGRKTMLQQTVSRLLPHRPGQALLGDHAMTICGAPLDGSFRD